MVYLNNKASLSVRNLLVLLNEKMYLSLCEMECAHSHCSLFRMQSHYLNINDYLLDVLS